MQGHVRKRSKAWSYIIDVGKVDGKRKQKEKGGFRTQKEAQTALTQALSELSQTGALFEIKKTTLNELFDEYLKFECTYTKKPSTIVKHKSIYNNHFRDLVGYKYIGNISSDELQEYLHSLINTHSVAYIRGIYAFLTVLFNYALKKEYLKTSPISKIKAPKLKPKEVITYNKDDILSLYKRLKETNLHTAFVIGLYTGVRAGECYGITWDDVDFQNNILNINKQLQYVNGKWSFVEPKTSNSNRKIKMSLALSNHLMATRKKQEESKCLLGDYYKINPIIDLRYDKEKVLKIDNFVNAKPDGEMLNTYSHKYISRIAKSEFGIDFKYHNLRHTHATLLLQDGASVKYIQERLGHARPNITLEVYSHVTSQMEDVAVGLIDKEFDYLPTF